MNKINAKVDTGDFGNDFQFLNFQIDRYWLDEKLEELYPGNHYKGLVPTLDYALYVPEERALVWNRILPTQGETTICPILMCPDDCDFSCTLLVAEIENQGTTIVWNRIGINTSSSPEVKDIGTKVEWFYKIGALEFELEEYFEMLEAFRKEFEARRDEEINTK